MQPFIWTRRGRGRGVVFGALLAIGAGLLGPAPAAEAGGVTRTVPSLECPTIQDCVDASAGGDTIRILARSTPYFETVTIPSGLDGLIITGASRRNFGCNRVVIDAGDSNGGNIGFNIDSDGITLDCLVIQNGNTAIDADANGLTVRRVTARSQRDSGGSGDCSTLDEDGDGINVTGNDFLIERSEATGTDCEGISAEGDSGDLLNNRLRNAGGDCIFVDGALNQIQRNNVKRCDNDGIQVEGDGNTLFDNLIQESGDDGIDVFGNNARVEQNTIIGSGGGGIVVVGDNFQVLTNRVDRGEDESIEAACSPASNFGPPGATGDCTGARVIGNLAAGSQEDEGFDIFVDPAGPSPNGLQIVNNTAQGNVGPGFRIEMSDGLVEANTALRNGALNATGGFIILGSRNTVQDNVARENRDDGFNVQGDDNTLRRNEAKENIEDGLHVESGANNLLDQNTATNNRGEGIENDGTLTDLTNNTSSGNRQDCAGGVGGSEDVVSGNNCADGTDFDDPGQIDVNRQRARQQAPKEDDDKPRRGRR